MHQNDQIQLLTVTQTFSSDIRMEFGVDKCARFRTLGEGEIYKYLEISEALGIDGQSIKPCKHLKRFSLSCWKKNRMQKAVLLETVRLPLSGDLSPDGLDPCLTLESVFCIFLNVFFVTIYI